MSLKPVSFHILERVNQENLLIWTYPTIAEDLKIVINNGCFSKNLNTADVFYCLRCKNSWIYIKQFLNSDKQLAVIFISQYYHPALYRNICELFVSRYIVKWNPVDLVESFLKLYIEDRIKLNDSSVKLKDFTSRTNFKGLIKQLGIEIILIYNALILKKQILVFHTNVEELQKALDSIARLLTFRKPESMLQPLIFSASELKTNFYLFGTNVSQLLNQRNSFDLLVNLEKSVIDVSSKAKDFFILSPLHKEIAHILINLAKEETDDIKLAEIISKKTSEIFKYLQTFQTTDADRTYIVAKDLEARTKNKNLVKFLINLSIAENMDVVF